MRYIFGRVQRIFYLLIVCAAALVSASAQGQEDAPGQKVEVIVKRIHDETVSFYDVRVDGFVRATPQQIWKVLTDYDAMHIFVPDLTSSKVISRNGNEVIVAQEGKASFLFISKKIHLVLRVTEQPFSRIDIALVSGNMKQYASHWDLLPITREGVFAGTRISYFGKLEPDFFAPSLFGSSMVETSVKKMVEAMIVEIDKSTKQPSDLAPVDAID